MNSSLKKFSILLLATIAFQACKKTEVGEPYKQNGYYVFEGLADSVQIVPSGVSTSPGTAIFSGIFDANSKVFNYALSWKNLIASPNALVFRGSADSGFVGINLRTITLSGLNSTGTLSGVFWNNTRLTDNEFTYLVNGKCYFVLASSASPIGTIASSNSGDGGEIRGQIKLKEVRY